MKNMSFSISEEFHAVFTNLLQDKDNSIIVIQKKILAIL